MMRSLYSGVAGLKTHQVRMDVIGHNIANVNTTAYKSSSMVFSELMSQTTQRASGPNATLGTGGVNARQIGLGVKSGAININIEGQGSAQSTGNPFDIMITGDNFFVVSDGISNYFTRDGSFYVDAAGNLAMTSTGYNVMGWQVDPDTGDIKQDTVTALRIMSTANMTYPPEATSEAYMGGIIDKNDKNVTSASGKVVNLNFYDALGYLYTAKFVFKQSDDPTVYSLELSKIMDSNGNEIDLNGATYEELFGAYATQEKAGTVGFYSDEYEWAGTKLMKGDAVIADLADLDLEQYYLEDSEVFDFDSMPEDVLTALEGIAIAYGYEGSVEEFYSLVYATPEETETAADGTVTVKTESEALTVAKLLCNLKDSGGTTELYGDAATLPTTSDDENMADDYTFDVVGRKFSGVNIAFDGDNGNFAGVNGLPTQITAMLNLSKISGNFTDIEIDFTETSMVDNKGTSTIGATRGDLDGLGTGRRNGDMIGVSIQQDGRIYASYDNGMTRLLGQIATAAFANASGLEKNGDNLYQATLNSGEFNGIGVDITANGGYMSTGQLEMSNVDLSAEFTEMITTQRGFQANSRIITVSDSLLEELTNLKR